MKCADLTPQSTRSSNYSRRVVVITIDIITAAATAAAEAKGSRYGRALKTDVVGTLVVCRWPASQMEVHGRHLVISGVQVSKALGEFSNTKR